MKTRRVLSILVIVVMMFLLVGCNYITRPVGVANNATENGDLLANLRVLPANDNQNTDNDNSNNDSQNNDEPNNNEPNANGSNETPAEDKLTGTFNVAGDVLKKIEQIIANVKSSKPEATSATGVKDELLAGTSIRVYAPYETFDGEKEAIKEISNKYNMAVSMKYCGTSGCVYAAQVRRAMLSGEKIDLMYVDQTTWGDIQNYAKPINTLVNFELGDKLGTFKSKFSKNFNIFYEEDPTDIDYYVASGIGQPYLLAYNKDNLPSTYTNLAEEQVDGVKYSAVTLEDPVAMFNKGTWSLSAMSSMLQQATTYKNIGLASLKNDKSNHDIWLGMDNVSGFEIEKQSFAVRPLSTTSENCAMYAGVGKTLNKLQSMYWTIKGVDTNKTIASWTTQAERENTFKKLFNNYSGDDLIKSFSMVSIKPSELADVKAAAAAAGNNNWDIVAQPYGSIIEKIARTTQNFDGTYTDDEGNTVRVPSAGWVSGFAVLDSSNNPAVALRFAEEYTKAWQKNYEQPILDEMTEDQVKLYNTAKDSIGVTFFDAFADRADHIYEIYKHTEEKISGAALANYNNFKQFNTNAGLIDQPMYDKNEELGNYNSSTYPSWSEYFIGKVNPQDPTSYSTIGIMSCFNGAFVPQTVFSNYDD